MHRTHTCGELRKSHEGKSVTLAGWVHRRRDHGGLIFIDLRDRYGITQIVSDPKNSALHATATSLRSEFVVQFTGKVRLRPKENINTDHATGEIEILAEQLEILNSSKTPPFEIDIEKDVNEEARLKYRYLDIRRERMKKNLILRHQVIQFIRDFMDSRDFIEVETPMLVKGTPEGSREYIVPSRLYPGKFYVLPQSPQQMKQLLMVAGMDRYFQIARCFRDEDQRGDRQPEFTQLDMEMSFVDQEDVMNLNEELFFAVTEKFLPDKKLLTKPLPRLTWQDAMTRFGSDKPDLRFSMEIQDVSSLVQDSGFKVFDDALGSGGVVHALCVEGGAKFSRKEIDDLTELAKIHDAKGLAYLTVENDGGVKSPIAKFFSEEKLQKLVSATGATTGDIVFFGADTFHIVCTSLGAVRLKCGDKLGLRNENELAACWVYNFPLLEFSKEEQKLVPSHHPFTSPLDEDVLLLDSDPAKVRAKAYDLVLNGNEIGGGSIRIHRSDVQSRIFDLLRITKEEAEHRFGHILTAFEYGAPPHGGIAWGLDRLIMIFCNEPNIREVIAFPKDSKAKDLMFGAPSEMPEKQIVEVHIQIKPD